jgi:hypothetical protein
MIRFLMKLNHNLNKLIDINNFKPIHTLLTTISITKNLERKISSEDLYDAITLLFPLNDNSFSIWNFLPSPTSTSISNDNYQKELKNYSIFFYSVAFTHEDVALKIIKLAAASAKNNWNLNIIENLIIWSIKKNRLKILSLLFIEFNSIIFYKRSFDIDLNHVLNEKKLDQKLLNKNDMNSNNNNNDNISVDNNLDINGIDFVNTCLSYCLLNNCSEKMLDFLLDKYELLYRVNEKLNFDIARETNSINSHNNNNFYTAYLQNNNDFIDDYVSLFKYNENVLFLIFAIFNKNNFNLFQIIINKLSKNIVFRLFFSNNNNNNNPQNNNYNINNKNSENLVKNNFLIDLFSPFCNKNNIFDFIYFFSSFSVISIICFLNRKETLKSVLFYLKNNFKNQILKQNILNNKNFFSVPILISCLTFNFECLLMIRDFIGVENFVIFCSEPFGFLFVNFYFTFVFFCFMLI